MKIIIVGGVAVGASTLARLKRLMPEAHVVMFEKDEYISFANCGLPYYIGGVIQDREDLIVQTEDALEKRTQADIRVLSEVKSIDPVNKVVEVFDKVKQETYLEDYDYLVLSPGAKPFVPKIEGLGEAQHVYTLRNISDVDAIYNCIHQNIKEVTIVGSGFIGVEVAENLIERGFKVRVIELSHQILAPFDDEMAKILLNEMIEKGVEFHFGTSIESFSELGKKITLTNGKSYHTDMTIMAIGVAPDINLAQSANLKIGQLGGIVVNETLQTSNPYIYAGGDAIEVNHFILNEPARIPLAWPANRQGRLIADNIAGKNRNYVGTQGTSILKVFNLVGASTGINEKLAKAKNIPYVAFHIQRSNHASYYPESTNITLKVLYHRDTFKVLGAQAVGEAGVDKRIDVIATAIHFNATIFDLQALELSYAPPFSSAKDPVNIAGYVGENIVNGLNHPFYVQDIKRLIDDNVQFVDVRTVEEFAEGHIKGSVNVPVDDLICQKDKIDFSRPVYLICRVGLRGYVASTKLRALGFEQPMYNLSGGYMLYESYFQSI